MVLLLKTKKDFRKESPSAYTIAMRNGWYKEFTWLNGKKRKQFCPHILYSFEIYNNIIWLIPINVNENNRIYKSYEDQILKL